MFARKKAWFKKMAFFFSKNSESYGIFADHWFKEDLNGVSAFGFIFWWWVCGVVVNF